MSFSVGGRRNTSPEEMRILRTHWEWAGRHALLWIIATIIIFGGMYVLLDLLAVDERVRVPVWILLGTLSVINAVWRAVGALAAHLELTDLAGRRRE
jgi:hypothetical protein